MRKRLLGVLAAVAVLGTIPMLPAQAGGNAKVNVVHGIPGVPVNVCVNGASVRDDFRFGNKIRGAALPEGSYKVKLVGAGRPCSDPAILTERYTLPSGANVTIVAALNAGGNPRLRAFVNWVGPVEAGSARLQIRHVAHAPAVNVWANGAPLIDGDDFVWGRQRTTQVPAGDYKVKVTLPGETAPIIGPAIVSLDAGLAYQIHAVGTADSYRLVVIKVNVPVA
jgi:hypothetical protein